MSRVTSSRCDISRRTNTISGRSALALLPILILLCLAVGCATDKQVISKAADVHAGLEPAVLEDRELSAYFQQIGDRIVETAQDLDREHFGPSSHNENEDSSWMFKDMQFHLVNSKTLNAFTTGGKHM